MFSPFLSENLADFQAIRYKKGRLRSARPMTMLSGGPLLIRTPYQAGVEYDRIFFILRWPERSDGMYENGFTPFL